MPTSQQILGLLRSHANGDDDRFRALALQLAGEKERRGHKVLAAEIRKLVDDLSKSKDLPKNQNPNLVPIVSPRGDLAGLMAASYPKTRLSHMVLSQNISDQLTKIIAEHRQRWRLVEHGLAPRSKLLLIGPPGSGKTMTASALAGELKLPLFTILLHGVITKFMGETATKLRAIFDSIVTTRGVYLFDEIDAIGGQRGATNDVGEARRILNSFLQFLEEDHNQSIILATTNHPEILDRALFRRFNLILEYALPTPELIVETIKSQLSTFPLRNLDWRSVASAAVGLSNAEVIHAAEDAARDAVLAGSEDVELKALCGALEARRSIYRPES